jgi:hypothetical protein
MSCNIRRARSVACMSLAAVTIEGPEYFYPSLRRPTGGPLNLLLLTASVDKIFTWCATSLGCEDA